MSNWMAKYREGTAEDGIVAERMVRAAADISRSTSKELLDVVTALTECMKAIRLVGESGGNNELHLQQKKEASGIIGPETQTDKKQAQGY